MQNILTFVATNWDAIAGIVGTLVVWLWSRPVIAQRTAAAQAKINELGLAKAEQIALAVVAEMYQTTVRELKEKGTFDAETKTKVAAAAGSRLKAELQFADLGWFSKLTPSLIEFAVNSLKGSAAEVAGPELDA